MTKVHGKRYAYKFDFQVSWTQLRHFVLINRKWFGRTHSCVIIWLHRASKSGRCDFTYCGQSWKSVSNKANILSSQGLAQATQPTPADTSLYKGAYQSADLFMHPSAGYHHSSSAKHLNFMHGAAISPTSSGSIFPSATSYWTNPGAANLYSNIAAASNHASMGHHPHHPSSHMASHLSSYSHYAWSNWIMTKTVNRSLVYYHQNDLFEVSIDSIVQRLCGLS